MTGVAQEWQGFEVATRRYKARLADLIAPGISILHAGCGRDRNEVTRPYRDQCRIVGVDTDPSVEFHSVLYRRPLENTGLVPQSFDLICCEYVLEHVEHPEAVFREFRRLLRPTGRLLVLTPNLYAYTALAALVTPQWFHHLMGRMRYGPGCESDMYRTRYRCNTVRRLRTLAQATGFEVLRLELVTNGPAWLPWFPGLNLYHRLIARHKALAQLRCALLAELTVTSSGTCSPEDSPGQTAHSVPQLGANGGRSPSP